MLEFTKNDELKIEKMVKKQAALRHGINLLKKSLNCKDKNQEIDIKLGLARINQVKNKLTECKFIHF